MRLFFLSLPRIAIGGEICSQIMALADSICPPAVIKYYHSYLIRFDKVKEILF